ncbi:hypothetical protein [Vibrio harveyi]|uniref:hypothetical protein n=1 Tax=Vibrio harveyi TaxID=669 RepID=UPI0025AF3E67|nr:hypothetical protein [Vibrio harveyi]WJT09261.1 hypothetical protein PH545_24860 [Vibrio harveyi]
MSILDWNGLLSESAQIWAFWICLLLGPALAEFYGAFLDAQSKHGLSSQAQEAGEALYAKAAEEMLMQHSVVMELHNISYEKKCYMLALIWGFEWQPSK